MVERATIQSNPAGPYAPGQEPSGDENADPQSQITDPQQSTQQDQQGELLAGKFQTTDELARAYQELEQKLGQQGGQNQEQTQDQGENQEQSTEDETQDGPVYSETIDKTLSDAGLEPKNVAQEFQENGQLSEDTFAAMEKAGFPREMVQAYVNGLQANQQMAEKEAAEIKQIVGSEQDFNQAVQWAQQNLPQDWIDSFNRMVDSGKDAARMAVEALNAKYRSAQGTEANLKGGKGKPAADVYQSRAEVERDMADPRYNSDPAFRNRVEQKLMRSNVF